MANILAKMSVVIAANTAEFNQRMAQSQKSLHGIENAAKSAGRVLSTFGVGFGAFQLVSAVRSAINIMADFEKQISIVRAITGATGKDLVNLKNNALELGRSTKFTAREVAGLQVEFGRLGFSTKEILAATEATLNLATAADTDLARAAEVAGSTVRGFGLDASETSRVTDVMALSFSRSALALDNFAEGIKFVAPIARAANVSIEETTALLAVLADAGIKGTNAGTALRRILVDLSKDGRPFQERLKELADGGITLQSSFDEVGRIAQTALLIIGNNIDKTSALKDEFDGAAGAAKRMADVISDNLTGDVIKLQSAFEGLILTGGSAATSIREFVQDLTKLVSVLGSGGEKTIAGKVLDFAYSLTFVNLYLKSTNFLFGLFTDNAKEASNELSKVNEEAQIGFRAAQKLGFALVDSSEKQITSLASLRDERSKLLEQFSSTDIVNKKELNNIAAEIRTRDVQIKKIEDLIKSKEKLNKVPPPVNIGADVFEQSTLSQFRLGEEGIGGMLPFQLESLAFLNTEALEVADSFDLVAERANNLMDISGLVAGGIIEIADAFGEAASGSINFGDAILRSLGGFAQQFGALLISTGIAKISFDRFNGPQMVAAGAALVALGGLVRGTISRRPNLGGSGGSFGGGISTGSLSRIEYGNRIELSGEFILDGARLKAVISNQNRIDGRVKSSWP